MPLRLLAVLTLATAALGVSACKKGDPTPTPISTAQSGDKTNPISEAEREANRQTSLGNLKELAYAVHSHHDMYMNFPQQAWTEKPGIKRTPGGLSWRVHLLKQLKQEELYKQFKLDEPWDSEHNKKLIEKMPKVYVSPGAPAEPGQTYYKLFVGPGTAFANNQAPSVFSFGDGTSNTIMIVEGGVPIIWTKPDDILIDLTKPLPDLSLAGERKVNIVMFDGYQRILDLDKVSEATLKAAITPAGKDVLGPDWNTGATLIPKKKDPPVVNPPRVSSKR